MGKQKRTTKKPGPPAKAGSRQGQRVWHITDFQELYELSDDIRKKRSGPLRYVKSLATLSPFCLDAETRHFERLCRLKARIERHLLRSVFEDLKTWCATKSFGQRGYLVTAEGRPASCEYLGEQLMLNAEDIKQALPVLEQIGLLERIPMNGRSEQTKPKLRAARRDSKTGSVQSAKKQGKKSERKNREKPNTASKRTVERSTNRVPDSAGLKRKACAGLRVKNKDKAKNKNKVKDKGKATLGLTASGCKRNINENDKDDSQGRANEQVPYPPTTHQPLSSEPQVVDAPGGNKVTPTAGPPASLSPQGQSRHGLTYGRRVYLSLGFRHDVDSPEARREIASFASKHDQVVSTLSGLSPPAIDTLLARGLTEAVKINKRKGNRNKAAVWHTVIGKLAAAQQQRSPP